MSREQDENKGNSTQHFVMLGECPACESNSLLPQGKRWRCLSCDFTHEFASPDSGTKGGGVVLPLIFWGLIGLLLAIVIFG